MRQPATQSEPAPTSAATPVMARSRFPVWLMAALLGLVTVALYWPALHDDFVNYDDQALCHRESSGPTGIDLGKPEMGIRHTGGAAIGIR